MGWYILMKVILWLSFILPWFSLFFMKKDAIKRFMPVAIFVSLLVTILFEVAYVFKWWVMLDWITPWGYITNVAFTYGAFLVGTMWIFHFTYKKFWIYLMTNIIIDAIFMFGISHFFEGRIYQLVNMSRWGVFWLMIGLAVTIYGYHAWQQDIFKNPHSTGNQEINRKLILQ